MYCTVLCHVASLQVVSPPLGWSPLSYFLVVWSPSGDMRGPSVVFDAIDTPCPGQYNCSHIADTGSGHRLVVRVLHSGLCGRGFDLHTGHGTHLKLRQLHLPRCASVYSAANEYQHCWKGTCYGLASCPGESVQLHSNCLRKMKPGLSTGHH